MSAKAKSVSGKTKSAIRAPKAKPAPIESVTVVEETPVVSASTKVPAPISATPPISRKDKKMTTIPSFDFAAIQTAFSDIQAKAKAAYEKSGAVFGDYGSFTKGNVEALTESGKILAAGLQAMGTGLVAESRAALETITAEVKELAAVKSPAEFVRLHGELTKKHLDDAVAFGSKQSEAVLKLTTEVAAPLSTRLSLAAEKLQKAA